MSNLVHRADSETSWEAAETSDDSSYVYESGSDDYVFQDESDEEEKSFSNIALNRLESYNRVDETKLTKFVNDKYGI